MESDLNLSKNALVGFEPIKRETVKYWQSILSLEDWKVIFTPISEMQVVDSMFGDTPGHELVGVVINSRSKIANIYHTRYLSEEDIIHEFLHVRFRNWTEDKVNVWTNKLINSKCPSTLLSNL